MWWNSKRKQENSDQKNGLSNRLASGVNNYVAALQTKLATFLNQKTAGLSSGGKKFLLAGVCLVFGGMSLYLIINTIWGAPKSDARLKPMAISMPEHMNKTGDEKLRPHVLVNEDDIMAVRTFKVYMDSLRKSANGKPLYDSILKAKPGLMDTVVMLEEMYLLQKK